ncbi:MAG: hypothetical protein ABIP17_03760 [Ilumatobacteraceae bacterium]
MSVSTSLVFALGLTLLLAGLHLGAAHLDRLPGVPERAMGSFGGGISVAYVFLHLLPELADGNVGIATALDDRITLTPLVDLGIFLVALIGFTVFYGLEQLAGRRVGDAAEAPPAVFYLHLASFCVYNVLITYTMPLRVRTGAWFAALFTVAMGLHFVLIDRSLRDHYPIRFARYGRPALVGALLLGWGIAWSAAPTRTVVVSVLTAFLGGSVLLNVFKQELPEGRSSSFAWFFTGIVAYAIILTAVTAAAE